MKLARPVRPKGSRKANRRAGRGESSGLGTTAGRGHKGQKARSGGGVRGRFEGGQMPLVRRLPKFGFKNVFRRAAMVVNLEQLERFENGAVVDLNSLKGKGLIRNRYDGAVKILAKGRLTKALTVRVEGYSKAAAAAIEKAGGKAEAVKAGTAGA